MMREAARKRIVFVMLGSRGDVQPLVVIAGRMAQDVRFAVSIATHAELTWLCQRIAPVAEQRPLRASCFLGDNQDLESPLCVVDVGGRRRREWVEVCEAARDADLIVSNLFAMPACIHLAEKLSVSLFVCSPSLIPYSLPKNFEREFQRELPEVRCPTLNAIPEIVSIESSPRYSE